MHIPTSLRPRASARAAMLTRRGFLASLAAAAPLAVLVRQAHAAAVRHLAANPATLDALGAAVLPSSLGRAGTLAAVSAFRDWGAGYHEHAELNHGYGTSRLRYTGPTPATRWAQQLDALDAEAQTKHQRRFRDLSVGQRDVIVRAALQGERVDRVPQVADAHHVAVALLAHFYDSSAATDLCYQVAIGKETCRPLAASARKPLPVVKLSER